MIKAKTTLLLFTFLTGISVVSLSQITDSIQALEHPIVGLVLSGGGAKGFAHVGVLKVLEEAGIQPDIIGGTSMGSIVGGMYAIGYSTDAMEKFMRAQDWELILQDKIPRKLLTYEEKENAERLLLTFPFTIKGVKMKKGLYTGQNIETLLSRITSPVYKVKDFSSFQTPFLCIGTDLLTGEEVILDNGRLDQAMRASMAIPTFFTPYEYQGKTLVDGGVINNYPANRIKEQGADIIIGVDVQDDPKEIGQLNSMVSILDQITTFYRANANEQGRKLTDIYIKPDMSNYSLLDFEKFDSITYQGEIAARKLLPELKKLADSINELRDIKPKKYQTRPIDSIYITRIEITGLKKIKAKMIYGKLKFEIPSYLHLVDIENGVRSIYGTRFFEKVNYELRKEEEGNTLVIKIIEISGGELGAGFNMNTDYNVALFLNSTFRNIGIGGSKLFMEAGIGEKPRFKTLYIYDLGNKPGFGLNLDFHSFSINLFNSKGDKENKFDITNYMVDIFSQISIQNSFVLGLGAQYKSARVQNEFPIADTNFYYVGGGDFQSFLSAFFFLKIDTYNKNAFSTKGFKINAELKRMSNLEDGFEENLNLGNITTYFFKYRQNLPLSKKLTLKPGAVFAGVVEDKVPLITDWFGLGGQVEKHYSENYIPFTGLNLVEEFGLYTLVGRMGLQYNFARKQYITLKWDVGNVADRFEDLFVEKTIISGYGITYGYESFIGPVELTFMGANKSSNLKVFVNIGFWF
ncbi:MAG: patatin-like phospholipase family protein, partial [Bacteroidales bacterium]|nr:patatin-like phospholipase family protein [Bacteroidales bacterium]